MGPAPEGILGSLKKLWNSSLSVGYKFWLPTRYPGSYTCLSVSSSIYKYSYSKASSLQGHGGDCNGRSSSSMVTGASYMSGIISICISIAQNDIWLITGI